MLKKHSYRHEGKTIYVWAEDKLRAVSQLHDKLNIVLTARHIHIVKNKDGHLIYKPGQRVGEKIRK